VGGGDSHRAWLHLQQFALQVFFLHCFFHALALTAEQPQPEPTSSPFFSRSQSPGDQMPALRHVFMGPQ
jgi:hypothetical protein